MPGHVLSMGKLGWQPRSAVVEPREADAEGMGACAVFEPCGAGRVVGIALRFEPVAFAGLNLKEPLLVPTASFGV